jgi:hypothetical protein
VNHNGFRNVYRNRHWVRDLNRIRYGFLDGIGHRFVYRHRVRLRDVNRVRSVYRDWYWNLHRDRNFLFNGHWVRLWYRDRDFLGNCDGLHVALATVSESTAVTQT